MVRSVVDYGLSKAAAARQFNTTPKTVAKWVEWFEAEGGKVCATALRGRVIAEPSDARRLRDGRGFAQAASHRRADRRRSRVSATVSRIFRRLGLNRLSVLELAEPVRVTNAPPLARSSTSTSRSSASSIASVTASGTGQSNTRGVGWEYLHLAIDDHSRLAYSEILPDEKRASCLHFLFNVLRFFRRHGVKVQRVMTGNGSSFRSFRYAKAMPRLRIRHLRTKPYTPRTNGKAKRVRPDKPARVGRRPSLPNLRPSRPGAASLAPPLQLASTLWQSRCKTANQRLGLTENNLLTFHKLERVAFG